MSGEPFTYKVAVRNKASGESEYTEYKGFGRYIQDYGLDGEWKLSRMHRQNTIFKRNIDFDDLS